MMFMFVSPHKLNSDTLIEFSYNSTLQKNIKILDLGVPGVVYGSNAGFPVSEFGYFPVS